MQTSYPVALGEKAVVCVLECKRVAEPGWREVVFFFFFFTFDMSKKVLDDLRAKRSTRSVKGTMRSSPRFVAVLRPR